MVTILRDKEGNPAWYVLSAKEYDRLTKRDSKSAKGDLSDATSIKIWRLKRGLTQGDVATQLKITQSAVSQLENTPADQVSHGRLIELSKIFKVSVEELLKE